MSEEIKSKKCTKCKEEKSLESFSLDKNSKNGIFCICKKCCKAYKDKYTLNIKLTAFNRYPNKFGDCNCECCGESNINFLCIDHINGGGKQHRKEIGNGNSIYNWLKKNVYPDGFRVLCHNCNQSYGKYKYCPHDKNSRSRFDLEQYGNQKANNDDGTHNNLYHKLFVIKIRLEIIKEYGGKCSLCNESHPEFMEIDHINGYGQEIKKYGKKLYANDLHLYLKRNNFPKECYRLLCSNCNQLLSRKTNDKFSFKRNI